jgi:hypothetical protein
VEHPARYSDALHHGRIHSSGRVVEQLLRTRNVERRSTAAVALRHVRDQAPDAAAR